MYTSQETPEHEQVHFFHDRKSGLRAIIALHDTALGDAMGGCRMWPYASFDDALKDALRLSKGMSYKCALAGLDIGGGKSVIIGDPMKDKTPELLKAMAESINQLGGRYVAAEDSGTSVADMKAMQEHSDHIVGTTVQENRLWEQNDGDPSPATAYGVLMGIQASVMHKFGKESLEGLNVNIQGLGHVGFRVAKHLAEAGANIYVYDPVPERQARAVKELGAVAVSASDVVTRPADIFCPCALGAAVNETTCEQLDVSIVAGAANNQLATSEEGRRLFERGILYAPDFVINAGGIIEVGMGRKGESSDAVNSRVVGISSTLLEIFARSDADAMPTFQVAELMAQEVIERARDKNIAPRATAARVTNPADPVAITV